MDRRVSGKCNGSVLLGDAVNGVTLRTRSKKNVFENMAGRQESVGPSLWDLGDEVVLRTRRCQDYKGHLVPRSIRAFDAVFISLFLSP